MLQSLFVLDGLSGVRCRTVAGEGRALRCCATAADRPDRLFKCDPGTLLLWLFCLVFRLDAC